ncbi:MAG: hypothetical protein R2879_18430 [Saprospiraceae bacterium]
MIFSLVIESSFSQVQDFEIILKKDFLPNTSEGVMVVSDTFGTVIWANNIPEGERNADITYQFEGPTEGQFLLSIFGKGHLPLNGIPYAGGYFSRFYHDINTTTILDDYEGYCHPSNGKGGTCKIRVYGIDNLDAIYTYNGSPKKEVFHKITKGKLALNIDYFPGEDLFITLLANSEEQTKYIYIKNEDIKSLNEFNFKDLSSDLSLVEFKLAEPGETNLSFYFSNLETGRRFGWYAGVLEQNKDKISIYLPESIDKEYCFDSNIYYQEAELPGRTHFYKYISSEPEPIEEIQFQDFELKDVEIEENKISCWSDVKNKTLKVSGVFNIGIDIPPLYFEIATKDTKYFMVRFPEYKWLNIPNREYLSKFRPATFQNLKIIEEVDKVTKGVDYKLD